MGLVTKLVFDEEVAAQDERELQEAVAAHVENPGFVDAPAISEEEQAYIDARTAFTIAESMIPEAKDIYKAIDTAVEKMIALKGVGHMFQLPDGPVVKLQEAKGRYVEYKKYEFVRTKRADEAKGTLSVKEAQEMGFTVK